MPTSRWDLRRVSFVVAPALLWIAFAALLVVCILVRSVGDEIVPARDIHRLENIISFGVLPSSALQGQFYDRDLVAVDYAAFLGHFSWYFVPIGFGMLVMLVERRRFGEYLAWLLVAYAIADVMFVLLPVQPPWMTGHASRILLDRSFIEYTGLDNNPVAALPSLHAGFPALMVMFAWLRCSRIRFLAAPLGVYGAAVSLAVVYLGEHWIIDVYAGWALAGVTAFLFVHGRGLALLDRLPGRPIARVRAVDEWLNVYQPTASRRAHAADSDGRAASRPARRAA